MGIKTVPEYLKILDIIPFQNNVIHGTTLHSDCGCVMRSELVMVTPSKVSYLMLSQPRGGEMAAAKACNAMCESGMGYSIMFCCQIKYSEPLKGRSQVARMLQAS